jgi:hypothetical protein
MDFTTLVRFLVMKLIHPDLNFRFDMIIAFTDNYSFSGGDVPINSETLLVIDFMNLKIKSVQSFRCAHMGMMYIHIFIG